MAEIRLERVTKRFADGTTAVRDASFTVRDGEFFILVGPSGCGKSTLLNMIVGLEDISSGELTLDGRALKGVDPKDRNMAMVFQSYAIYPHMSVRENLAFPLKLAGLPRSEIAARVEETADLLDLTGLLRRKPDSLSGGQRQRVAMGRAIVRRPKVFLLDEPLSNLDARFRAQMRAELALLQRRLGITTLYVTHDQTEAMTLGDRVAMMRGGEIQQVGTPRELYHRPSNLFVAAFIGTPAMNLLPARLETDRILLPMVEWALEPERRNRLPCVDGPLIVGIRPEQLAAVTTPRQNKASGDAVFETTVELVEWLGAESLVYLDLGKPSMSMLASFGASGAVDGSERTRLIARLGPEAPPKVGARIQLSLNLDDLCLFDPTSGQRFP